MDFSVTQKTAELTSEVRQFMDNEVLPSEARYRRETAGAGDPYGRPAVMHELRAKARAAGLWNLFLGQQQWGGAGLSNSEFAPLCEQMGRSIIGPEAFNCQPPDAGNMTTLIEYATPAQQERWLMPMLDGEITSCFSMTEPDVASSDAHNIRASVERDGDEYVINARKWFSSGSGRSTCKLCIFVGVTDPDAEPFPQQSLILIPLQTPGVEVVRTMTILGYQQPISHGEIHFSDVRVPVSNRLQREGNGFGLGQARLGAGRLHHALRAIGLAERALTTMCVRVAGRETFGVPIADHGVIREWIARSRIEIEQARLLAHKAAWMMDELGGSETRQQIAAAKIVAPTVALNVVDRAIQAHGAAGLSQDTALAELWAQARTLRFVDGPDEVHVRSLGRWELTRQLECAGSNVPAGEPAGVAG